MKKNYILFLFTTLFVFATNAQTILFDQPVNGTSGIVSDNFSDGTTSVYAADDFNLSTSSNIGVITAYGFQNDGNLETLVTGVDIFIYSDAAGEPNSNPTLPGTGLLELVNLSPSSPALDIIPNGSGGYDIVVDVYTALGSDLTLSAGTYWLVVAPYVTSTGTNRWNWYQATDGTLSQAKLIDPGNVFNAGATSWTSLTALGLSFSSTAFKIEESILSVDEFSLSNVSVFPNPVQDELNIQLHNSITVKHVKVYSITGQVVLQEQNQRKLNVSKLSPGVYLMKIETDRGDVTRKIIKS
ncbi:T9SS type A sorting domain-containing protein [Xanthomarina gelatinilytica]|uniref:T9SS type A sorting domain-containing protein n=1 Tax=Xanthomarina gelatinilytica TaxID=1137281 RepID=UPI003AA8D27A